MRALSNWFNEAEAKRKREDLRSLILGLQQELNPDLDYDPTDDGCLPQQPLPMDHDGEEGQEVASAASWWGCSIMW